MHVMSSHAMPCPCVILSSTSSLGVRNLPSGIYQPSELDVYDIPAYDGPFNLLPLPIPTDTSGKGLDFGCFNCGIKGHSTRDCMQQRDPQSIKLNQFIRDQTRDIPINNNMSGNRYHSANHLQDEANTTTTTTTTNTPTIPKPDQEDGEVSDDDMPRDGPKTERTPSKRVIVASDISIIEDADESNKTNITTTTTDQPPLKRSRTSFENTSMIRTTSTTSYSIRPESVPPLQRPATTPYPSNIHVPILNRQTSNSSQPSPRTYRSYTPPTTSTSSYPPPPPPPPAQQAYPPQPSNYPSQPPLQASHSYSQQQAQPPYPSPSPPPPPPSQAYAPPQTSTYSSYPPAPPPQPQPPAQPAPYQPQAQAPPQPAYPPYQPQAQPAYTPYQAPPPAAQQPYYPPSQQPQAQSYYQQQTPPQQAYYPPQQQPPAPSYPPAPPQHSYAYEPHAPPQPPAPTYQNWQQPPHSFTPR